MWKKIKSLGSATDQKCDIRQGISLFHNLKLYLVGVCIALGVFSIYQKKCKLHLFVFAFRWKYVIYGILEVNVQPKLQMWSWEHIRHHRKQVKNYKDMYKTKITSKKPNEEILKLLEVSHFPLKAEILFILLFS